ncbi:MAG: hypothetical protein Q9175_006130 [Cornicularia normoerica]
MAQKSPPKLQPKNQAPTKQADPEPDMSSDNEDQATGGRKQNQELQKQPPQTQQANRNQSSPSTQDQGLQQQNEALQQQLMALRQQQSQQPEVKGGRIAPVRQSRILDRPPSEGAKASSLKIQIELDLEVEVDLYARVKGDITIGLM